MRIAASGTSALLAATLWNAGEAWGAAAAAVLSFALLLASLPAPRGDGTRVLRRVPRRTGALFAGEGREWTTREAESALLQGSAPWRPGSLFLPLPLLEQHALILGTTGTGKSRLLELLVVQATARGEPVAVIDPKGDDRLLSVVRKAAGARFRSFSLPRPEEGIRYNPVGSFLSTREVADRVAAALPSAGEAQAFRNYGWEIVDTVARALDRAGKTITFEALRRYGIEDPLPPLSRRPREHYLKMASALVPVLARLASCPALAPGWSWETGASERHVVHFFLGSLLGAETAGAVAKMALLDFQSWVGRRYVERRAAPFWLFVDELADVLTPEFVNVLNKARGAGVRVVACAQTLADLEAALGSRARAMQVVGNVSTVFQFRPQGSEDAEAFGQLAGRRILRLPADGTVYEPALFDAGHRGVDDFRAAFSRQLVPVERPPVPASALLDLPTFHYFARWGGRLWRGRVPLLDHEDAADPGTAGRRSEARARTS